MGRVVRVVFVFLGTDGAPVMLEAWLPAGQLEPG